VCRVLGAAAASGSLFHVHCESVTTNADNYIGGIKIYNTGMMEDPTPGSKRGKGVQHMNSDYWIEAMGCFIAENMTTLKSIMAAVAAEQSTERRYNFLLNQANIFFMEALKKGLDGPEAERLWLMSSWLTMAAAEVDDYPYGKYSPEQRQQHKDIFVASYLKDEISNAEVKVCLPSDSPFPPLRNARIDLLPAVALERLSLHNELCQVKYGDNANMWMKDGFKLSKRVDSLKRHIDEAHHKDYREDAIAHLIWNFMAIHHVKCVFPHMNDLPNFEQLAVAVDVA